MLLDIHALPIPAVNHFHHYWYFSTELSLLLKAFLVFLFLLILYECFITIPCTCKTNEIKIVTKQIYWLAYITTVLQFTDTYMLNLIHQHSLQQSSSSSSSRSPIRPFQQQWWSWWSSSGPLSSHILSGEAELLMATMRFALVGVCYMLGCLVLLTTGTRWGRNDF